MSCTAREREYAGYPPKEAGFSDHLSSTVSCQCLSLTSWLAKAERVERRQSRSCIPSLAQFQVISVGISPSIQAA